MTDKLEKIIDRLESVTSRLENLPQLQSTPATTNFVSTPVMSTSATVKDYEELMKNEFQDYMGLSNKIGGDVAFQATLVQKAVNEEVELIKKASTISKPSESQLQVLLKPLSGAITNIVEFREKNRKSQHFNHLTAISEGIPALGWVTVSPAPCPYIKEMHDASQFYTNRIIKEFKDKDQTHVEWTKAWLNFLLSTQKYVKQHFTTGLIWSGTGKSAGGAAPPPPPPVGVVPPASSESGKGDKHAALFAEINKGTNISSGLRKVDDSMKTHKNPELRLGSKVSANATATSAVSEKAKPVKDQPPVTKLSGNKWFVEHHKNNRNIEITNTEMKQTLVIYKCTDSVVTVKGKINSIMMDSCKKTAVLFDGLISSLDLVNCQSVQAQTQGLLAIVNIDKTDGAQIYLNKESLGAEIISAKSSEMNVIIPDGDDMKELPIPEQFKTKIVNGTLVTSTFSAE